MFMVEKKSNLIKFMFSLVNFYTKIFIVMEHFTNTLMRRNILSNIIIFK